MNRWSIFFLLTSVAFSFNVKAETAVLRSIFTNKIERTEPVSDLKSITNETTRIYFFTEIIGFKGRTITHRWEYNGRVFADVLLEVQENRWRTWSSKNMLSSWLGDWHVSVLDEGGNVLEKKSFAYRAVKVKEPVVSSNSN